MNAMISGCGGRVPRRRKPWPFQDRVVLLEPADLGLERLDLSQLLAGRALALPAIDLGLDHPATHRLLAQALRRATTAAAAVSDEYSRWWSWTSRTHRP